ncbi:AMP-binding protein [Porticoccus sp.]
MRLVDFLDKSPALVSGDAKFVDLDNGLSLSYRQMVNASVEIAEALRQAGVKAQDVIATYAPNSVAAYCCIFAISRLGAVWLPLNVRNTFEANQKQIDKSGAVKFFVDDRIVAAMPQIAEVFPEEQLLRFDGRQVLAVELGALADELPAELAIDVVPAGPDPLVNLFATGGTTGDSKLAEWSSRSWETLAAIQDELMPAPDIPGSYLVSAPMTHAAGVASFATIRQGASVVVMDGMVPERLLETIERYRVTHLFLPPTAIYMLLAHESIKSYDYSSLRYFWYAAAPMSVEKLKEAIDAFGPVMVQSYGQAEAPMICTFLSAADHVYALEHNCPEILRSCGKVSPHVGLAVMDDDWRALPAGAEGEIAVRGKLLMRSYYRNPEATAEIRRDGWQRTGDIGVLDANGYLSIVDRKRDMIISGGFNVYPSEIEQLIWAHPAVKDCAVIGIPDEKWGEQVTAVVELKANVKQPDAQEIIQYCKSRLGSVKAPKQVLFWDELPRSPVGKVLKKEIRKVFWQDAGRNI